MIIWILTWSERDAKTYDGEHIANFAFTVFFPGKLSLTIQGSSSTNIEPINMAKHNPALLGVFAGVLDSLHCTPNLNLDPFGARAFKFDLT